MSNESRSPILTVTDAPSAHAEALIEEGLGRFNAENAGYRDARPLAVLVSDPDSNAVAGGLLGRTTLGLLFIDLFFLPASMRKHGLGSRIMQAAEAEARQRGCRKSVVITINFQAPEFYQRQGYRMFGQVDCLPGVARIFLSKDLA
jgi:GNAT superfamily N-acetyltransferase